MNTMTPFEVLGLAVSATQQDAETAFRRLAQVHHPDKGGDAERFKQINEAWRQVKNGWRPAKEAAFKSSFGSGAKPHEQSQTEPPPRPSKKIDLPKSFYTHDRKYGVDVQITEQQGFNGCVVPFIHDGHILEFEVPFGTVENKKFSVTLPINPMIGLQTPKVQFDVNVKIIRDTDINYPPTNKNTTVRLNAIGLITGGVIKVKNADGVLVEVSIAPGFPPKHKIILPKMGYGTPEKGDLIITVEPIFKSPAEFTANDWYLVDQLLALKNV
jgi:DnaJ-class molecular chaperone